MAVREQVWPVTLREMVANFAAENDLATVVGTKTCEINITFTPV